MALVATLASYLAAELERTGEALHQRTSALASLQTLHQRTVESLMSGLLTTDRAGRITSFNPEAERITGLQLGGFNFAEEASGLQLGVINVAGEIEAGVQLGVINVTREIKGLQFGLINVIEVGGWVTVLPLINGSF